MSEKNWKRNKENKLTAFAFHCFSTVQRVPAEDIFEDLDDRCKQRSSQIQFFDYLWITWILQGWHLMNRGQNKFGRELVLRVRTACRA